MKLTLPLTLPTLPTAIASLETWRQVHKALAIIADREKNDDDLYPSERRAYNAIAFARYHASKEQWLTLWQYLLDRQLLRIGEVSEPPRKPKNPLRPTKPPKNKVPRVAKVAKPKRIRKRKRFKALTFKRLKPCLLRVCMFQWFAAYNVSSAILCRNKSPIRNRPDGERIKALLSYKTHDGQYANLKMYLPRCKARYKMNRDVLKLLLDWSNPLRERSEKKIASDIAIGEAARIITRVHLAQVLTDKWQDTRTILSKLNQIVDSPFQLASVTQILKNRFDKGEVFQLKEGAKAYYSHCQATEFESEWITREMAYAIAVSRGCKYTKNTFRKTYSFDYAAYGLEFRASVPDGESDRLRWRDIGV